MTQFAFDDATGKITQPSDEELKEADQLDIITFATFTTNKGNPYYAFLAVKPSRYKEYSDKTAAREPIRIQEYGTIIADGYGNEPPPDVLKDIEERYGMLPEDYEEQLVKEAKTQQKTFVNKQEEKRLGGIVDMLKNQKPNGAH